MTLLTTSPRWPFCVKGNYQFDVTANDLRVNLKTRRINSAFNKCNVIKFTQKDLCKIKSTSSNE